MNVNGAVTKKQKENGTAFAAPSLFKKRETKLRVVFWLSGSWRTDPDSDSNAKAHC